MQLPQAWTFDAHLIDQGWQQTRGQQSCPTGAMRAVKVEDDEMARMAREQNLEVMRPELGTKPRVYYRNLWRYSKCFIGGSVAEEKNGVVDCVEGASVQLLKDGASVGGDHDATITAISNSTGSTRIPAATPCRSFASGRSKTVEASSAPASISARSGCSGSDHEQDGSARWLLPRLSDGAAAAQTPAYPDRPITLVITSAPGGVTDVVGRALAQELTKAWGQQVIVENKGGAAHIIGAEAVAKAAPDGYTLLVGESGTFTVNPTLLPKDKVPYDTRKGFHPDHRARSHLPGAPRRQIVAGCERGRTDRAGQTEAGPVDLRHRRRRLGAAYEHGAVRQHGRA